MKHDEIIKKIDEEIILDAYIEEIFNIISNIYISGDIKNTECIAKLIAIGMERKEY